MKQTIKLYDIYSADLFTRSRASELRSSISDGADEVILDFEFDGVLEFKDKLIITGKFTGKLLHLQAISKLQKMPPAKLKTLRHLQSLYLAA